MENNNKIKVGKFENALDECALVTKVAIAGLGIVTSTLGLISGIRLLKGKHNDPDSYWRNKRLGASAGYKAIEDGLHDVADAIRNNKK